MLEQFLIKIFGLNYRTTISGLVNTVSIIAAGIALNPSGIGQVPEPYKGYLLTASGVIFFISNVYKSANTADSKVVQALATGEELKK